MDGSKSKHDIITGIIKEVNKELLEKIAIVEFPDDKESQKKFVEKYLKDNYNILNILKKTAPDPIKHYNKTIKKCV